MWREYPSARATRLQIEYGDRDVELDKLLDLFRDPDCTIETGYLQAAGLTSITSLPSDPMNDDGLVSPGPLSLKKLTLVFGQNISDAQLLLRHLCLRFETTISVFVAPKDFDHSDPLVDSLPVFCDWNFEDMPSYHDNEFSYVAITTSRREEPDEATLDSHYIGLHLGNPDESGQLTNETDTFEILKSDPNLECRTETYKCLAQFLTGIQRPHMSNVIRTLLLEIDEPTPLVYILNALEEVRDLEDLCIIFTENGDLFETDSTETSGDAESEQTRTVDLAHLAKCEIRVSGPGDLQSVAQSRARDLLLHHLSERVQGLCT